MDCFCLFAEAGAEPCNMLTLVVAKSRAWILLCSFCFGLALVCSWLGFGLVVFGFGWLLLAWFWFVLFVFGFGCLLFHLACFS